MEPTYVRASDTNSNTLHPQIIAHKAEQGRINQHLAALPVSRIPQPFYVHSTLRNARASSLTF